MACPVCEKRKPKRLCPAKGAKICSQCCGENRERTIACPLDCAYLIRSRPVDHKGGHLDPKDFPYREVRIDEAFLHQNGALIERCLHGIWQGAQRAEGALDSDVIDALEALTKSYKTRESGLVYDAQPKSGRARQIATTLRESLESLAAEEQQQLGIAQTRESQIFQALVFLYRIALDRDNERPLGRAFLHFAADQIPPEQQAPTAPNTPIILPGA